MAIVGMGLIGGSLAKALQGRCARLAGIDRDPEVIRMALVDGVIAEGVAALDALSVPPDVILLAIPVSGILETLRNLPEQITGEAVIMDVGSTKREIVTEMDRLPERFDPIGGHPMCGKETGGYILSEAGLFQDAVFALTPLARSKDRAQYFATALVQALGARALWLDADTHDRAVAHTSHLPYLLANLLAGITPDAAAGLAGPGFSSTTRLAPTPPDMMQDVLRTNRDNLLSSIYTFQTRLAAAVELLEQGQIEGLVGQLQAGAQQYHHIQSLRTKRNVL